VIHLADLHERTERSQRTIDVTNNPIDGRGQRVDGAREHVLSLLLTDRHQAERGRDHPGDARVAEGEQRDLADPAQDQEPNQYGQHDHTGLEKNFKSPQSWRARITRIWSDAGGA